MLLVGWLKASREQMGLRCCPTSFSSPILCLYITMNTSFFFFSLLLSSGPLTPPTLRLNAQIIPPIHVSFVVEAHSTSHQSNIHKLYECIFRVAQFMCLFKHLNNAYYDTTGNTEVTIFNINFAGLGICSSSSNATLPCTSVTVTVVL